MRMTPIEVNLTDDEKEEATERRLAEIEFIESAYSPEEAYFSKRGDNNNCSIIRRLHLSTATATSCCTRSDPAMVKVDLSLEMPSSYPLREDAILIIQASLSTTASQPSNPPFVRKAALNAIPQLVETCQRTAIEVAESQGGGEAVWSVLCRADEWVDTEWEAILEEHRCNYAVGTTNGNSTIKSSSATETIRGNKDEDDIVKLGRRIIYSHHIIANSKRRDIATLTSRYKLGGYMKIGWPGIILIEGNEMDCITFVDEIKRWRWQQLQVRGEEQKVIPEGSTSCLDSHRQLPIRFEEIGEDGLSLFANHCREANLESLFLTCMKINDHRTTTVVEEKRNSGESTDHVGSNYGVLVHVDHMNDGKRYRKWLRKTCQAQGCTLFIRQCYLHADAAAKNHDNNRPTIYVGIFGDKDSVKQVMKLWRTSRVDVDSKNKPCLERMMDVVEEGELIGRLPIKSFSLGRENDLDCSFDDLENLVMAVDTGWAQNLRNRLTVTE